MASPPPPLVSPPLSGGSYVVSVLLDRGRRGDIKGRWGRSRGQEGGFRSCIRTVLFSVCMSKSQCVYWQESVFVDEKNPVEHPRPRTEEQDKCSKKLTVDIVTRHSSCLFEMGRASHVEDDGLLHFKEAYESCKKDGDQPLTRTKKSPPGRGSRAAAGRLLPPWQPGRQLR